MGAPVLRQTQQKGFTLVEILVVLAIVGILFAVSLINLGQPHTNSNLSTTVDTLVADIKTQQILAMSGDTGGTTSAQQQGIYFQPNQYTLFAGSTYNSGDPHNFTETIPSSVTLSTTLPGAQLLFVKGSGDIQSFAAGSNTITLNSPGVSNTITLSRFGAVTVK